MFSVNVMVVVRLGVIFIVRSPPCHSSGQSIPLHVEAVKPDDLSQWADLVLDISPRMLYADSKWGISTVSSDHMHRYIGAACWTTDTVSGAGFRRELVTWRDGL